MKVLILGQNEVLFATARYLVEHTPHQVVAIVTAHTASEHKKREEDFRLLAGACGARLLQMQRLDDQARELITRSDAEVGVSIDWVSITHDDITELLPYGICSAHFGDLSCYRGNAITDWAMTLGQCEVVLTVHQIGPSELDERDLLLQKRLALTDQTTVDDIDSFTRENIPKMFAQVLDNLEASTLTRKPRTATGIVGPFRRFPRHPRSGVSAAPVTATKMPSPDPPLDESRLPAAVESAAHLLQGSDSEFFHRVWRTDLGVYRARLAALGMRGLGRVLDAGSGMGQWTVCLAEANEEVHAVDLNLDRVRATAMVADALGLRNIRMSCQALERLDYPNENFDAIFSYSVLYLTDYRKVITEFFRVLKPGGRLYICSNGVGWYVYNLLRPHNRSTNFDSRRMALETMSNTLAFAATGRRHEGKQLIVSSRRLARELKAAGFEQVVVGGEGTLRVSSDHVPRRFFRSRYYGLEGVYELLARRRRV